MMGERSFVSDDRAVTAHVSHVLAMGIVSLLVIGLLYGANTHLTSQQEQVAERGLETVGNNLATELTQVDRMQAARTTASLRVTHPERIAGSPYDARLATDGECDGPTIPTDTCLVLSTANPSVTVRVPVRNETALTLDQGVHGRFEIASQGADGADATAALVRPLGTAESSLRLGIGEGIEQPTYGETDGGDANVPPIGSFRADPEYPSVGTSQVTFSAEAEDPDGDDADLVYRWDFDDDGTYDATGETASATPATHFPNPGVHEVELNVTDRNGNGKSTYVRRNLTVSGLVYAGDFQEYTDTWNIYRGVKFTIENRWTNRDVEITGVFINQTSNRGSQPLRKLTEVDSCLGDDPEVIIDGDTTDSYTRDTSCGSDVPYSWSEYGLVVPVDDRSDNPAVVTQNGGTAEITIRGYEMSQSVTGQDVRVVVQHTVDGQTNATSFTVSSVTTGP